MQFDQSGFDFVKENEGFTPVPTGDNGHLMWGHGHDQLPGEIAPESISEPDADALLWKDLRAREPFLNKAIGSNVCTQNQFNALGDFQYNDGDGALMTMLHHGWSQVPVQLPAWCYEHINGELQKSNGLAARRAKEVELFQSP